MWSEISLESLLGMLEANWRTLMAGGAVTVLLLSSYDILQKLLHPYFSPLRRIKGPKNDNFLFGHAKEADQTIPRGSWHKQLLEEYGHVIVYKFLLNVSSFCTIYYYLRFPY
jgi:hypothetical protein